MIADGYGCVVLVFVRALLVISDFLFSTRGLYRIELAAGWIIWNLGLGLLPSRGICVYSSNQIVIVETSYVLCKHSELHMYI